MSKSPFPLHQAVLEDASHIELVRTISEVVAELRRRALLSKSYEALADQVIKNAARNAALREAGVPATPVLDALRAKHLQSQTSEAPEAL